MVNMALNGHGLMSPCLKRLPFIKLTGIDEVVTPGDSFIALGVKIAWKTSLRRPIDALIDQA